MKRRIVLVAIALAIVAIVARVFFWKTDEEKIRARIGALAGAGSFSEGTSTGVYALRLKSALREAMTPDAVVDSAELGGTTLRADDVVAGAAALAGTRRSAKVVVRDLSIEIEGTSANGFGRFVLTGEDRSGGGLRVDERAVRFELRKGDDGWKITRIRVEEP